MTSSLLISRYSHWYQKTKGLTGWWFQPPGKIWKSDWIIIPTIGENKTCSKPPTSYSSPVSAPHLGLLQHTLSSRGLEFLLRLDDGHGCHGESSLIYIYVCIIYIICILYHTNNIPQPQPLRPSLLRWAMGLGTPGFINHDKSQL